MRRAKRMTLALGTVCLVGALAALGVAGCAPQTTQPAEKDAAPAKADATVPTTFLPAVIELEDGTKVQRTPDETVEQNTLDGGYSYFLQSEETIAEAPYNTTFLHANERGCNSCHEDLASTLNNMQWSHVDLSNGYGIQVTVQMCKDCHTFGYGYMANQHSFGSLIHGIHQDTAQDIDCWSCHVGTDPAEGMQLWDEAKFTQLRGIRAVSDIDAQFSYDQDKITPNDALFDFDWLYYDNDFMRHEKTAENAETDQETFDTWTVTLSGAVQNESTRTLPELVDAFGTENVTATLHCTLDSIGGPLIQNCEYTGIPLKKMLDEAGVASDAAALQILSSDGFVEVMDIKKAETTLIGLQVNGETLPWDQGYPAVLVAPGAAAPAWVKEVSDIVVLTEEEAKAYQEWNGWPKENVGAGNSYLDYYAPGSWPFVTDSTQFVNKPSTAIFDFQNGQIIKVGEPYEFTGYATAYDETIAALEFSMDGGISWKRFDTPNVTNTKWVIWHFTYTPQEETAYVLSVRAITDTGRVSDEPVEVMFNAKSAI